jgi:hypothetical protein
MPVLSVVEGKGRRAQNALGPFFVSPSGSVSSSEGEVMV